MMREAEVLRKIADNVCIKVPLTIDGLKTCKKLTGDGTMVNVTLCFSANQALLAAKAGATFVSPFVGRHDDNGFDGMALISDIRLIYDNYAFATEILVASVRHPIHVLEAAKIGADVMTAPPAVNAVDSFGRMRLPRRRSIVSSMASTTGPLGAKAAISSPSSRRAAAAGIPRRAVEHPMVVGEPPLTAEACDTQEARHGAPAGGQNGADQQQLGMAPGSLCTNSGAKVRMTAAKQAGRCMAASLGGDAPVYCPLASPPYLCRPPRRG